MSVGWKWMVVLFAVGLDVWIWRAWRKVNIQSGRELDVSRPVRLFGQYSPILTWARSINLRNLYPQLVRFFQERKISPVRVWQTLESRSTHFKVAFHEWERDRPDWKILARVPWTYVFEISLLLCFTLIIGRDYLNMNPARIPAGGDYPHEVYNHIIWTWWEDCPECIFWNGTINGGDPAFANIHEAALHPLTILTTLAAGVVNGSKIMLLCILFFGGVAQWWLARELELGALARIWCGVVAILGPQYNGRLESGLLCVTLATTSAALSLPLILRLLKHGPSRRTAAVLGWMVALLILSGQGYIQLSFAFGLCPIIGLFLVDSYNPLRFKPELKSFVQAGVIGILLAAVLLVPFGHFLPYFSKDTNSGLDYGNTLPELLTRLVKENPSDTLNSVFMGGIVIALAGLAFLVVNAKDRRWINFMGISAALILVLSSETFLQWIFPWFSSVEKIRFPTLLTGLAVPLILALSGVGLNGLWLFCRTAAEKLPADWFKLIFLLRVCILMLAFFSIQTLLRVNNQWLYLWDTTGDVDFTNESEILTTDSLQWVEGFYGLFQSDFYLQQHGFKLTHVYRPWWWNDRENPWPSQHLSLDEVAETPEASQVSLVMDKYTLVKYSGEEYSQIEAGNAVIPCAAHGNGGKITLNCASKNPGRLTVKENYFSGWKVSIDGQPAELIPGSYLQVAAPAGSHRYEFRYDPWDVKAGLFLTLVGAVFSLGLFFKRQTPVSAKD